MNILVTGASGFIGMELQKALVNCNHGVRLLVRRAKNECEIEMGHSALLSDLSSAFVNVECVIHLAARAHVLYERTKDPLAAFREVNTSGTFNLARHAVAAGVRRFVFISTIKVNGELTRLDQAFNANDIPAPQDPYAVSKYEAEQGLMEIAGKSGMEVVIIRPPLVYGPGVKANFLTMMRWLQKGLPMPLGAVHNKRSLVSIDNLLDLIVTCLDHPAAANQVFLAGDGEDLSTPELLRRLGLALGRPARLFPVPVSLLKAGSALLGKSNMAHRLCGSLQVDIAKARNLMGWTPPISVDEGLRRTAQSFIAASMK
jgi:UDP-glucose 4-epimerase